MHLLTPAAFSVSLARCERITEPRGGKKKTSDESQCTQWRCLHSAVRWYLQAIHHLWAVTAETQSYQYPSLPPSLAPIPPLAALYFPHRSLTPLAPAHFPSFSSSPPQTSSIFCFLPRPHLLSVSGWKRQSFIHLFFSSFPAPSIYTGKYRVASRK